MPEPESEPEWMEEAVATNPSYTGWGVGDDYMCPPHKEGGKDNGWRSGVENETWDKALMLDDLNECVHFKFSTHQESRKCVKCVNGWSEEAEAIYQRVQDENRKAKDWSSQPYDQVLRECEAKGYSSHCEVCDGAGYISYGPFRLQVQFWFLVPRKGCSRGARVLNVTQEELPEVYAFLRHAAIRNARNFARVPDPAPPSVKESEPVGPPGRSAWERLA